MTNVYKTQPVTGGQVDAFVVVDTFFVRSRIVRRREMCESHYTHISRHPTSARHVVAYRHERTARQPFFRRIGVGALPAALVLAYD